MHALISPTETVQSYSGEILGQRVSDVSVEPFPVAEPFFWIACDSDVDPEQVYYDADSGVVANRPVDPQIAILAAEDAALALAQTEVQV
jgi:hypothetical protein